MIYRFPVLVENHVIFIKAAWKIKNSEIKNFYQNLVLISFWNRDYSSSFLFYLQPKHSSGPDIPPHADLVFEVELKGIQRPNHEL
jgi:hypothetical protein